VQDQDSALNQAAANTNAAASIIISIMRYLMKFIRKGIAVLAVTFLLAGCKNFWLTTSPGGCTTNCSTVSSGVFYLLNSNIGQVALEGYSIVNGSLTALAGSPYSLSSTPYAIAVAPNNRFLYVSTASGIYLYTIGTSGALTLSSTTPIITDFAAYSIQVDATNTWLVDASESGYLYAIPINSSTGQTSGAVQQLSLAGIASRHVAISPDNTYIFVALGINGTEVIPFSAASTNPLPTSVKTLIATKNAGGASLSVAVDPGNRLFYIGETLGTSSSANTGVLRAFSYASLSSTLTEATGSPYASGGLTPVSILPIASGGYVYVANSTVSNSTTGSITGFAVPVNGSAYSLTQLNSSASTGVSPACLAEDSTGLVVLLVNSGGSPDLNVYTFDANTPGNLDSVLTFATGTDPVAALAIAAAP
jgi:6-phosphogluconolactonase (cycloisomerase 2 family)